ncbi:MAG: hypothetical protein KGI26_06070 [Thaumarchaeota archaeon]|nr:hypothetical protein [Nitrososphaerota archaeon]
MTGQATRGRLIFMAAAIVSLAFLLRASPYLASGVPYHTDTYPQLANARNLVASTPVSLSPAGGFDSYNIFWPADLLFFSVSSVVLGGPPVGVMPLLAPLVSSLMVVLFLALLLTLGIDVRASAVATLLFAVAGGSTMISTGVTKEGFAIPLMLLVLLLLNLWLLKGSRASLWLSVPAFAVLLASHSLTSVVGLLLSAYLGAAYLLLPGPARKRAGAVLLVTVLFSALSYLYFYVYAVSNLPYLLQPSDVVSLFAYEALFTLPVWLGGALRLRTHDWAALWLGLAALGVSGLFASALAFHALLDSPLVSPYLLFLVLPYLVVSFLAAAGIRVSGGDGRGPVFASLWALGLLGIVAFTIFGTPGAVGTSLRIADFVYPGVAILGAIALSSLMGAGRVRTWAAVGAVGALVLGSVLVVPYTALWSGPAGGSQRLYSPADIAALGWVARLPANQAVYGDARASYLASYYLPGKAIDVGGGFVYLAGVQGLGKGCLLVSGLVSQIGYIGPTYGLPVNMTLVGGLPSNPSLRVTYSDGLDRAFCSA